MEKLTLSEAVERLNKATLEGAQRQVAEIVKRDPSLVWAKQDELERGQRPDGQKIGFYRDEDYALFKNQINPLPGLGNVDLILTGSTRDQLYVESLGGGAFRLRSRDPKWSGLMAKYAIDGDLMEISGKRWQELQKNEYAPKLVEYVKKITRL